jgi:hypothetical protein
LFTKEIDSTKKVFGCEIVFAPALCFEQIAYFVFYCFQNAQGDLEDGREEANVKRCFKLHLPSKSRWTVLPQIRAKAQRLQMI